MDILTNKVVKTRKCHLCHGCGKSYDKGTKMRYTTSVDAGDISSAYWCKTCDIVIDTVYDYFDLQDGIGFCEVRDENIVYWETVNNTLKENME